MIIPTIINLSMLNSSADNLLLIVDQLTTKNRSMSLTTIHWVVGGYNLYEQY